LMLVRAAGRLLLTTSQRRVLRRSFRRLLFEAKTRRWAADLPKLAQLYGTDKWGTHWYARHYQRYFAHLRKRPIVLLEIGVGGFEDPRRGGESLRMWKRYFPKARIYGVDLFDKSAHDEQRIKTFRGDQTDENFLRSVISQAGTPDIIIDDGSHINSHVRKTFEVLFPLLAENGIYAIEDLQTSYWEEYGGTSNDFNCPGTGVNMLKGLVDGLNYKEFVRPGYTPTYSDKHIVSLHFYHNLAFVLKGRNDEESNMVAHNASDVPEENVTGSAS